MPSKTILLNQTAYDFIMDYKGNKSDFISMLIMDYVNEEKSTDPEKLESKKAEFWREREILDLKIDQTQKEIIKLREIKEAKENKENKEQLLKEFKREYDEFNRKFRDGEITEEEYWAGVDERARIKKELLE